MLKNELRNTVSQAELKRRLAEETELRRTLSFYQYHPIVDPRSFRDEFYKNLENLNVFGRIYIANEGVNAQMSVPEKNFAAFKEYLYSIDFLDGVRLNIAVEDDGKSFWVLHVKVRPKIVADGIDDATFSMANRGAYLDAEAFNNLTERPQTVVVDMRNYYEYEVGHFDGALEVSSDTFREQLPMAVKLLEDKKDAPVIMYCTGGIRCEKASAYLLHNGFTNVYHLEGGIIEYTRQVKEKGLTNKFRGKNFVFDDRLGEQISGDVISRCHQCGELSDTHRNCANGACHLLFIQCESCRAVFDGCCGEQCRTISRLPAEEQQNLRRGELTETVSSDDSQPRIRARFFDVAKKRD